MEKANMVILSPQTSSSLENTKSEEDEHGGTVKIIESHTETEVSKISLMRSLVESQDPSAKEHDDKVIKRFLRARDGNIQKGSAMMLEFLKWRHSFVPNASISLSEVQNEVAQNKMFMQGHNKEGQHVIVVFGARHFQNKIGGLDEFKRFVVYGLDKVCSRMPPGQEKFVGIGDLKGWGYSNFDIRGYLGALKILQDYYPERLGKMFIVNSPYIFMTAWKIVYPFIDKNTKKKIVFVEANKVKSTLMEDIEEDQIPQIYGGQMPLIPIHNC